MTGSCACGRPTTAHLCRECTDRLEQALGDVTATVEVLTPARDDQGRILPGQWGARPSTMWDTPRGQRGALAAELQTTITRQSVLGETTVRGAEQPVPWDERAADAAWVLRSTLAAWVDEVTDQPLAGRPSDQLAGDLLVAFRELTQRADAAEAHDEIVAAVELAARTVDTRPVRWYAGPCDTCGEGLYGDPDLFQLCCRGCGRVYDLHERRAFLADAAREAEVTATDAARALGVLGRPVTPAAVRVWRNRGKLDPVSVDLSGRPLYRLGDVMDVAGWTAAGDVTNHHLRQHETL